MSIVNAAFAGYRCNDCGAVSPTEDEAARRCTASGFTLVYADDETGELYGVPDRHGIKNDGGERVGPIRR